MGSSISGVRAIGMAASVLGFACAVSQPANATVVVDQSNLVDVTLGTIVGSGITHLQNQVQTFTVGVDGTLAEIDLQLFTGGAVNGNLHASLYRGDYAQDEGDFMTPVAHPTPAPGAFVADALRLLTDLPTQAQAQAGQLAMFDTTSLNLQVHVGDVFSILLDEPVAGSVVGWVNGYTDASGAFVGLDYPGGYNSLSRDMGATFIETGADRGFQTKVDVGVPEPATWALVIGGFGLVGGALRRRSSGVAA